MTKGQIVWEIVLLLQGTPVHDFAQRNLAALGERVVVRCAQTASIETADGQACKRSIATALLRYSYRFTQAQLRVLVDLYATALEQLDPVRCRASAPACAIRTRMKRSPTPTPHAPRASGCRWTTESKPPASRPP